MRRRKGPWTALRSNWPGSTGLCRSGCVRCSSRILLLPWYLPPSSSSLHSRCRAWGWKTWSKFSLAPWRFSDIPRSRYVSQDSSGRSRYGLAPWLLRRKSWWPGWCWYRSRKDTDCWVVRFGWGLDTTYCRIRWIFPHPNLDPLTSRDHPYTLTSKELPGWIQ